VLPNYDTLSYKLEKYAKVRADKAADRAKRRAQIAAKVAKAKAEQVSLEDKKD
jgi:hypothetical protein